MSAMDWNKLRNDFFKECTDPSPNSGKNAGIRQINLNAHNLFEWFKNKIETRGGNNLPSTESKCNKHDVIKSVCDFCKDKGWEDSEPEYCKCCADRL